MRNPPPAGIENRLAASRQSDYLLLTILGSSLLHTIAIGLLSLIHPEQTVRNEPRAPGLSVTLPSGGLGKDVALSTHGQPPSGETRSITRKHFQRAEVIPGAASIGQIDTSLYADPENIDDAASVIEAPELPLPPGREVFTGMLRIKIFVNEEGAVDQIDLMETSLQEDYATQLIETFKESKFIPGMLHGKPVKSWRVVEIDYIDP